MIGSRSYSIRTSPRPLVVVGVPHHHGDVHIALLKSLIALDRSSFDIGFADSANAEVAINRNIIVQKFLDHPAAPTHLLFVDSDMGIPSDTVEKLLAADQPIVSGVAVQKFTNLWVAKQWGNLWDGMHTVQVDLCEPVAVTEPHWLLKEEHKDKVVRIGATGAACLLIKREVLETVPYPWFYNEFNPNATGQGLHSYMSEDISFCFKADKYGFGTYLHTGVLCDHHMGTRKFPPFWEKP
jgi:hypothetical protein